MQTPIASDFGLIEHYATMHPSDPRRLAAFPTEDGQRLLNVAYYLSQGGRMPPAAHATTRLPERKSA